MFIVKRFPQNPIISPKKEHPWEAMATFNGVPLRINDELNVIYRAMSPSEIIGMDMPMSVIGRAVFDKDYHITSRESLISPSEDWDKYGCEDPRVTKIDGKFFILYTALSEYPFKPYGIKIGVAVSKDLKEITEKHLVTTFNSKAMGLFPEKINGKYWVILTVHTDLPPSKIALACLDSIEDLWASEFWSKWYAKLDENIFTDLRRKNDDHVEVGAAPVLTEEGWLLVYFY